MQKVFISGLLKDKKDLLSYLMKKKLVDIQEIDVDNDKDLIFVNGYDQKEEIEINEKLSLLDKALIALEPYDLTKKPLFKVRRSVDKEYFDQVENKSQELLLQANELLEVVKAISSYKDQINKLESELHFLQPWLNLNVSLDEMDSKKTEILLGTFPEYIKWDEHKLKADQEELLMDLISISSDRINNYVLVVIHKDNLDLSMQFLKTIGFNPLDFPYKGYIKDIVSEKSKEIKAFENKIEKAKENLKTYALINPDLQTLYDSLAIKKTLLLTDETILSGKHSFVLEGWAPQEKTLALKEDLENKFHCYMGLRDAYEEEEFPVLLENGFLGDAVSGVTEMFSLPSSKEADPNTITAIFFALFFGMMLSDAGYGLVMVLACAFLLWKFKMEETTARFMKLMLISGIATVLVGALYGSWFGNFIPTILSRPDMKIALWFDPIDDPNRLLLWSLILGVVHVYVGYGMKGYNSLKKKKYLDAILDVIPWYFFYTSAVFMVSSFIPSVPENIYNMLSPLGSKLFPYSIVLILLTQGRKSKGIFGKLFGGIASLYDLISFMGDVLSYSRLLAMGLATGVIATIINQMGASGGFSFGGLLAFAAIFIVGHGFNFAINALGAYVHSSRLQYIEFFNKFFEGGGKAFSPLREETKYIVKDYKSEE